MLIPLMALFGVVLLIAGTVAVVLRRRRCYPPPPAREEEETLAGLHKAFGKANKWGWAGGAEHELHEHAHHDLSANDGAEGGDH